MDATAKQRICDNLGLDAKKVTDADIDRMFGGEVVQAHQITVQPEEMSIFHGERRERVEAFRAFCSCGWAGQPELTKKRAATTGRLHARDGK